MLSRVAGYKKKGVERERLGVEDLRVIYIAGYGRSGSTLLDLLLGSHPDVFGAGELTWLFRDALCREDCTCGTAVIDCEFWSSVFGRLAKAMPGFDMRLAANVTVNTERLGVAAKDKKYYLRLWDKTFDAIAESSGCRYVVDSSKTSRLAVNRLPFFLRGLSATTSVLHLVRDPRGVMWSCRRGSNRRLAKGTPTRQIGGMGRGLCGWMFANAAVEKIRKQNDGDKFFRLRYEDLMAEPTRHLQEVGEWLCLPLDKVCEQLENGSVFEGGHGIAGNRMRRGGSVVMKADDEWCTELPGYAKIMAEIARAQMRKYGYLAKVQPVAGKSMP